MLAHVAPPKGSWLLKTSWAITDYYEVVPSGIFTFPEVNKASTEPQAGSGLGSAADC
jgi:hypothetical protein